MMLLPALDSDDLKAALRCLRGELPAVAGFSFFINALALVSSIYTLQVFDRVISSRSQATLLSLTVMALGALAVLACLEALRRRLLARIATWLETALAPRVIEASIAARLRHTVTGTDGLRDLAELRRFLTGDGILAFIDAPWLPVFLLVLWLLHPLLALLAIAAAVLLLGCGLLNEHGTRGPLVSAMAAMRAALADVEQAVGNAQTVCALGMRAAVVRRFERTTGGILTTQLEAADTAATWQSVARFVRLAAQIGVTGLGASLVIGNELTPGGMIAGAILLTRALAPVERSIGTWRSVVAARQALQGLDRLLAQGGVRTSSIRLPAPQGRLTADTVRFLPQGGRQPILRQVSFELEPGELCAVMGSSGAGKSTLCRLLVGALQPSFGEVRLDDADIAAWDSDDLGRHIGYLPQGVELFAGSVASNIARLGEPDARAVMEAAGLAKAHRAILRLADGYDTEVGSFGTRLSGGQRQLVGLARALYGDPPLIVLDEPNAHLDPGGEEALVETLRALKARGRTVVLVMHDMKLLPLADKLLYLRDGIVQAYGPRQQVLVALAGRRKVVPLAPVREARIAASGSSAA